MRSNRQVRIGAFPNLGTLFDAPFVTTLVIKRKYMYITSALFGPITLTVY